MAIKLSGVTTYGKSDTFKFNPLELIPRFAAFTGRQHRSEEAIDNMVASLLKHGQEQAFTYRKGFNDEPIPVTGHTRILAAARITERRLTDARGVTYGPENPFLVRGEYRAMNDIEAVVHTFIENDPESRTPVNDVDIAFLIRTLSENFGISDAEIADKLGKPASWVSKHRKVLELDSATQQAIADGSVAFNTAVDVVANIEPSKRKAVIEKAKAGSGKATGPAIAKAAEDLGAKTKTKLKRTDADFKAWLNGTIEDAMESAAKAFLVGMRDYRAGKISEEQLNRLFVALEKKR